MREGGNIVVDYDENLQTVMMKGAPTTGPEAGGFTFDRVFPQGTMQHEIFEYGVKEYAIFIFFRDASAHRVAHVLVSSKVG